MKSRYTLDTYWVGWGSKDHPKRIVKNIARSIRAKCYCYWHMVRRSCVRERWLISLTPILKEKIWWRGAECINILRVAKELGLKVRAYEVESEG